VVWFFAGLAATSTVILQRDVMAEPRVYLAAAGLIVAVFAAAAPYLAARRAPRIAATAVLAVLVVLTSMRIRVWSDPLRLWTEAVERSPDSWLAHLEFSEALKEAGQCDRAVNEMVAAGGINSHLAMEPPTGWAPCPRPPLERWPQFRRDRSDRPPHPATAPSPVSPPRDGGSALRD
jgi:hypothetical protein